ncbi:MAG: right-handed parallel beta-helix repeat-containing protein, partial [Thermoplasmata archaeon]
GFTITGSSQNGLDAGLDLVGVDNCRIMDNILSDNSHGICISSSHDNSITGNVVSNNIYGITLSNARSCTLESNAMVNNGLSIEGNSLEHWNTHAIDTTNTVGGKPVRYYTNESGLLLNQGIGAVGQLILANCSDMTVENQEIDTGTIGIMLGCSINCTLKDNLVSNQSAHGILLWRCEYNTIENTTVTRNNMTGIKLFNSEGITIKNSLVFNNDYSGIYLYNADNSTIQSVDILDNGGIGLFVRGDYNMFSDVNSSYNDIGVEGDIYCSNNTFKDCTIFANEGSYAASGISLLGPHNQIINCDVSYNNHTGISIRTSHAHHNIISGCNISYNREGVKTWYSAENTTVSNCTITSNENDGIVVHDTSTVTVDACLIQNSMEGIVFYSPNNTVSRSDISNNNWNGIRVEESHSNTVYNCTFISNRCGVSLKGSNNTIYECTFMQQVVYGVSCQADSWSNLIYHNNFIDNLPMNARDYADNNFHNGYASGGNYWSDYNGSDHYSGPDQDIPGSDGIGDTPYEIAWYDLGQGEWVFFNASYPLMSPYNIPLPAAPQNLNASAGYMYVNLTWDTPAKSNGLPIVAYMIYRGTASDNLQLFAEVGNITSYNDTAVASSTRYYYRVQARNEEMMGILSDITSTLPAVLPSSPINLTAAPGDTYILLSWEEPIFDGGTPIMHYVVYRGTVSGEEVFLQEVDGEVLSFNNTRLYDNVTYYYRVSAKNVIGEGPLSNRINATPIEVEGETPPPSDGNGDGEEDGDSEVSETSPSVMTFMALIIIGTVIVILVIVVLMKKGRKGAPPSIEEEELPPPPPTPE